MMLGGGDDVLERGADELREGADVADYAQAHVTFLEAGEMRAEDPFPELEQAADLLERPFPILGGESEDRQHADAAVDARIHNLD